jgi:hypothetical protein
MSIKPPAILGLPSKSNNDAEELASPAFMQGDPDCKVQLAIKLLMLYHHPQKRLQTMDLN